MKQQELIRPMERSATSWGFLILFIIFPLISEGQVEKNLTKEQYQVIEDAFRKSGKDETRIFFQTIDYKSWVHLLYGSYYRDKRGIALCSFEDPNLERAIDQLIDHVSNIRVKELSRNKLGKRFTLINDLTDYPYLSITEPIIIGEYSFILFKYPNSESLSVQKKNSEGNWVFECAIPLYVVFID
ncbi:hypothetical protein Aconfl_06150 [Algoriphagus confluentis]|uniref:Uncharacterized protein n=2 Tax=Algoriphagus confluentis TaxID=1697556 RepID=A0ABQ6PKA9_9BACT|nr:hypothetical protein Aconfl_06150 [Algoriphagus confluentis]